MIDPIGWISAAALAFGLFTGGYVDEYGAIVGATITADGVTVGVTPIVIIQTPVLNNSGLNAITLGGTVLMADLRILYADVTTAGASPELVSWLRSAERDTELYELGHIEGWSAFGLRYPLEIARNPCRWDPDALWGCRSRTRADDGWIYPPRHWSISASF